MGLRELLRWQWGLYPGTHCDRANLLLHICTAPFFWAGTVILLLGLFTFSWGPAALGFVCVLVALIAQPTKAGLRGREVRDFPADAFPAHAPSGYGCR